MIELTITDKDGDRVNIGTEAHGGDLAVTVYAEGYHPLAAWLTDDDLKTIRDAIDEHLKEGNK